MTELFGSSCRGPQWSAAIVRRRRPIAQEAAGRTGARRDAIAADWRARGLPRRQGCSPTSTRRRAQSPRRSWEKRDALVAKANEVGLPQRAKGRLFAGFEPHERHAGRECVAFQDAELHQRMRPAETVVAVSLDPAFPQRIDQKGETDEGRVRRWPFRSARSDHPIQHFQIGQQGAKFGPERSPPKSRGSEATSV